MRPRSLVPWDSSGPGQCPFQIIKRAVEVALGGIGVTQDIIGQSDVLIELNRNIEIRDGLVEIAPAVVGNTPIVECQRIPGIKLDCLIKILDRGVVVLLFIIGDTAIS